MSLTPNTSATPYVTAAEFLRYVDANYVGQLTRDDGLSWTAAELVDGDVETLNEILLRASGDVESACIRANLFEPEDLRALLDEGGSGAALLRGLVSDLAVGYLSDRRAFRDQAPLPAVTRAREQLEMLTKGMRIFPFIETQAAGRPVQRFITRYEVERSKLMSSDRRFFGYRSRDYRY